MEKKEEPQKEENSMEISTFFDQIPTFDPSSSIFEGGNGSSLSLFEGENGFMDLLDMQQDNYDTFLYDSPMMPPPPELLTEAVRTPSSISSSSTEAAGNEEQPKAKAEDLEGGGGGDQDDKKE